jgi:hypothetical protein
MARPRRAKIIRECARISHHLPYDFVKETGKILHRQVLNAKFNLAGIIVLDRSVFAGGW